MKPVDLKPPFIDREERRAIIQDRVWYVPDVNRENEDFEFPGWNHPLLFGNDNPVYVEYCSGNGAWILERARSNPNINWVAVEIKFNRTRKIWSKIKNYKLDNLIVICGEGLYTTKRYFPNNSVAGVFVNFPDPWPKRKHAKYRLIQSDFVAEVGRITCTGGQFTLVTDDPDYSVQMIDTVSACPKFSSCFPKPYFVTDEKNYGSSWFENLWRSEGKTIRFHKFQKVEQTV
ncbi:MAG: tRNA (guanine(46)-N(7))-methyltransferase TrmB [Chlamydiota bacterium]|nr:tRNA (guanine(46)-N(7))-methyltransferase TrmB [Chlamydiota bacterium]